MPKSPIYITFVFLCLSLFYIKIAEVNPGYDYKISQTPLVDDNPFWKQSEFAVPVRRKIYYGLWDHFIRDLAPDEYIGHVNIGKSMQRSGILEINSHGIPAIMHIGGFSTRTQDERKKRIDETFRHFILDQHTPENMPIIHFEDEPLSGGITGTELDELLDYTKQHYGHLGFKFAYTINRYEMVNNPGQMGFAQTFDYVFHQVYPYRNPDSDQYWENADIGDNKEDLVHELDWRLKRLKEIVPGSKYFIIAQGFSGADALKWRPPPLNAPFWYVEWAMQNDIEGILYWKERSTGNTLGLNKLNDYRINVKNAYQLIPKM